VIYIGICDDIDKARQTIFSLCETYFNEYKIKHKYVFFSDGEDVLFYCENDKIDQIDLLFLDINLPGISGIALKDEVLTNKKIQRIVFVTNYSNKIYNTFSRKTIGFIPKPPLFNMVKKMLDITIKEIEENIAISIKNYDGTITQLLLNDIVYFKASGCYTEIITKAALNNSENYILSTKKMGDLEKEMKSHPIIRVHRSYMVNLENVIRFREKILLEDIAFEIPVGRLYKEQARMKYLEYVKNRIDNRI
jgi:DNA-binding LytR/AlgR family response regulator